MEMPLSRSMDIQSDVAILRPFRPRTMPAVRHDLPNWGWVALSFGAVGLLRLNLLWVLLALGPLAVALAWLRIRRG